MKNRNKQGSARGLKSTMVLMILVALLTSTFAYGAEIVNLKISQTGGYFAMPGDVDVQLSMRVENKGSTAQTFSAKTGLLQSTGSIMEPKPSTAQISLQPGASTDILFLVNVAKTAKVEDYQIPVILVSGSDGSVLKTANLEVRVIKKSVTPGASGDDIVYTPAYEMVHKISPSDAIEAGSVSNLTLSFVNSGNTVMKNTIVSLGLPDGITINNGSNSQSVGYVSVGSNKVLTFSLAADSKVETKNYPFTVKMEFDDYTNSSRTIEQTIYLPVRGSGASGSLSGLAISDINLPGQINAGDSFTLNFKVANKGDSGTGQLKIYAEAEGDILNKTQKTFVESNIASGDSKTYSVTFMTKDSTPESAYTIKIGTESVSDGKDGIFQYASVYVRNQGSNSIKTPQLMVESYSYGGSHVQAGDEFRLDLVLRNTSSSHVLRNIKLTLESPDGTFIPVRSSNSFFIDRIGKSSGVGKTMYLSVSPNAEQKTTSLNISMSYEDSEGNSFTANDIVSIPVMQDTRLMVEEILSPPEVYVGMQSNASVDFYNMGKTKLNNLRINASGNFDVYESNSYYVGNMEPGTEDSYDFSFIPRETGLMQGKIIFTYEDASGHEQNIEKDFEFSVMEMPIWDDEDMFPPDDLNGGGGFSWPILAAVLAVLAVGGFIAFRIIRKRKMQKELEIDEY